MIDKLKNIEIILTADGFFRLLFYYIFKREK